MDKPALENMDSSTGTGQEESAWGVQLTGAACTNCQAVFYVRSVKISPVCPRCLESSLTLQDTTASDYPEYKPELMIPFSTQRAAITQAVERFSSQIPFPPLDLTAENIIKRLQPHFLSAWLVDVDAEANWHSEMGFDYQVISHQDRFDQSSNRWLSQEIEETRVNWEPRLGKLTRTYHNTFAPALEEENEIRRSVGIFDVSLAQQYQPQLLPEHLHIELPNRPHEDAWNDAVVNLQSLAADECRQAGSADHIRNFRWEPTFKNQNWSLLLRPTFSSYYLDDQSQPHKITIHGTIGAISGSRIASKQRAQSRSLNLVIIAAVIFFIGLLIGAVGILVPPILVLAGLLLFASMVVAISAVVPLVQVWQFNRQLVASKSS